MKKMFTKLRLILGCAVFVCISMSTKSQDYAVRPADDFVADLKSQHRIILNDIEARTDLSISQKLALLETETNKLKTKFRATRTEEYQSKSTSRSVSHSCTSNSSGGVKNCKTKCVSSPIPDMYTSREWIRLDGKSKGISVDPTGQTACLKMTVAGKGRNAGTITATYKYKPDRIVQLVEDDLTHIFNRVVENR